MRFGLFKLSSIFLVLIFFGLSLDLRAAPLLQRSGDKDKQSQISSNEAVERNRTEINLVRYELTQQIETLQMELQALRGVLEQQNYTIEQLRNGERERYADLDARINSLQSGATILEANSGVSTPTNATDEDEKTYNSAKQKVDSKEYNAAIAEFTLYLEFFPEGKFLPQAHYWMGELYLSLEIPENDNAKKHYETVVRDFPSHSKVPGCLYKLGLIYKTENNSAKARENFERLIREFPSSSTASLAKKQLSSL